MPTWSHDGRFVYFSSQRAGSETIWRVPVAGGPEEQVTHTGGGRCEEAADGQTLFFLRATFGNSPLLAVSLAVARAAAETTGQSLYRYVGGTNGRVHDVTSYRGNLVAVGEFTNAGGTANRIALWNGSGSLARRSALRPMSTTPTVSAAVRLAAPTRRSAWVAIFPKKTPTAATLTG